MKITDERDIQVSFFSLRGGDIVRYQNCYYMILDSLVIDSNDDDCENNVVDIENGVLGYICPSTVVDLITNYEFIIK